MVKLAVEVEQIIKKRAVVVIDYEGPTVPTDKWIALAAIHAAPPLTDKAAWELKSIEVRRYVGDTTRP